MSRIHLRFTYWCWQCGVFCTHGPPVCLGCLRDSAPMPISTQKAPSARTVGDFRQSLAFLHVSHPPALYILVLAVWCLLHTRPSGVPGVSEGLSSDAYRHSEGTQCPNCRGFPSVAGVSACLASTCTLHTGAGSAVSSAHTALRCDCGV